MSFKYEEGSQTKGPTYVMLVLTGCCVPEPLGIPPLGLLSYYRFCKDFLRRFVLMLSCSCFSRLVVKLKSGIIIMDLLGFLVVDCYSGS